MSLRQRESSIRTQPENEVVSLPPPQNDIVVSQPPRRPPPQNLLTKALQSSANLANLLPTGTLLAFQTLTPIFTKNGSCSSATSSMTFVLLVVLALSCFLASFTDSLKCANGEVHYGFVTRKGLWLFDNPDMAVLPDLRKFRLTAMDMVHAFVSVMVFVTVALRDKNVVGCFYPTPGQEVKEVLDIAPIGIGLISSMLFVAFPTRRNGIGYPVTIDR